MTTNDPLSDADNPLETSRGEGIVPPRPQRDPLAELRLFRHALAQGWSVSADLKASATGRIREILANNKAGSRAHVAATRCLLTMTSATVSSIDCAVRVRAQEDLVERLERLEAWQAGGGADQAEQRPRIEVPLRDRRHDRNRVVVTREDRASEEPDNPHRSPGGSPPAPPSPRDPSSSAVHDPEADPEHFDQ
jgi:hypothetical protein